MKLNLDDIIKIIGLLPILSTLVFAWLNNRNEQARRRSLVDDAKKQIELISAYVTSQNLVINDPVELGEIKKSAANELKTIKTFLDNRLQILEKTSKGSESYLLHFFLLYKMNTVLAGFFRVLFFITLLLSILWSTLLASSLSDVIYPILFFLVMDIPVILFALLFRWLAIRFDKPIDSTK